MLVLKVKPVLCFLALTIFAVGHVIATPLNSTTSFNFDSEDGLELNLHEPHKRQNAKVELRILPLGASIVYGYDASDKNG